MEEGYLVGTGGDSSQYISYPSLNRACPYLAYEIKHAQDGMGTDLAFPFCCSPTFCQDFLLAIPT